MSEPESALADVALTPAASPARLLDRLHVSALWATRRRAAITVGVVAMLVYVGSLWDGFAYDDVAIVAGDPRIRGFQLWDILRLPYWRNEADLAIYRPLTSISFALDWLVARGAPWFSHALNALEHGAVSMLVFALLAELFALPAALLGALVFALHPVHVEAVANIVGRAEVLSAIFYLWALLLWVRKDGPLEARRLGAITLLYALALLAKESSATLPAVLVLADFARGRWRFDWPSLRAYVRRAGPLLLPLAGVLAGFIALRLRVLGRMAPSVVDPVFDLHPATGERIMTALQAWPVYARLLFFPRTLLADYSPRILMPAASWTALALAGLFILVLLLVLAADALGRGRGRTAFALLWFPVTVLPVSNLLFPIGIMVAERTMYLPMMAVCFAAAAAAEWAARSDPRLRRGFAIAAGAALALLTVRTVTRIPVWDNTNSVFYALEADRPDSFRAAWHLARVARVEKKPDLEMRRYEKALRLWPYRQALVFEAAGRAIADNRLLEARNIAAFAARRWPDELTPQRYLAATSLDLGDTARARVALRAALAIAPQDTMLLRMARAILPGALVRPDSSTVRPRGRS